jgi:hypothetical protein
MPTWWRDLGVSASTATDASANASSSISAGFEALTHGLVGGIDKLASLAVFLSFTALSLFLHAEGRADHRRLRRASSPTALRSSCIRLPS